MPQKKSAAKALRRSRKRFERNRAMKRKIRMLRKGVQKALVIRKIDKALELFRAFQKAVDKASKAGGFMKRNTAARYKSRLLHAISQVTHQKS